MKARRGNRRRLLLRRPAGVSTVAQQNLAFFAPAPELGSSFPAGGVKSICRGVRMTVSRFVLVDFRYTSDPLVAIAFALKRSRKIIRGLKQGLTEEERYAVADHAVAQLKERGDPWRLNEEATPTTAPPST
jgi:hypothetical protein